MATVFLNGNFVSRDQAKVSAFDAAFQHGVGLFETMLATPRGVVLHLHEHMARLKHSALELGLSDSIHVPALAEAVDRTVGKARDELQGPLRVRLTISGGDLNMLERGAATGRPLNPTLLIVASPATEYPDAMFARGVSVVIADYRANPLDPCAGHKTINYWPRLRELQSAAAKRAGEALVLQVTNHLCGGCVSNAFIIKANTLITPIARGEETGGTSPVLPGITRKWVLDWAEAQGIKVERRMVTIHDVLGADEVFLTNSSWGVLPVVKVEAEAIGDGVVGAVATKLRRAWEELTR